MSLTHITCTGVDENQHPRTLARLSQRYPFLEYGVLVSGAHQGTPRFPRHEWIAWLQRVWVAWPMRLSLHICGQWARDVLRGRCAVPASLFPAFQRVQLNLGQIPSPDTYGPRLFTTALRPFGARQLIFQIATAGSRRYLEDAQEAGLDCVPLFDTSGGQGIRPSVWANAVDRLVYPCYGYAGGLSPDTLAEQLPRIAEAAGSGDYWIDMETGVRTGERFDLGKVEQVCQLVAPFVRKDV